MGTRQRSDGRRNVSALLLQLGEQEKRRPNSPLAFNSPLVEASGPVMISSILSYSPVDDQRLTVNGVQQVRLVQCLTSQLVVAVSMVCDCETSRSGHVPTRHHVGRDGFGFDAPQNHAVKTRDALSGSNTADLSNCAMISMSSGED